MVLLPVIYKCFCNAMQLLEVETKLIYITHFKDSLFKLDNIFVLQCMYILS
jgi:hypothetical protein